MELSPAVKGGLLIFHRGEERLGLHLDGLRQKLPRPRPQDAGQGIIDIIGLAKADDGAILFYGVSLSS